MDAHLQEQLKEEHLVYIDRKTPGFFRLKTGKTFKYYDLDGKLLRDKKHLERIESMTIPPAWEYVWISPKHNTHLQATGVDEKGRTQYIYHPDWVKICQENKFAKMIDFGKHLPTIRQKVDHDLHLPTLEKRKILATVVWLLEHTFIRIGNEEYSTQNQHYGLTTLRRKHASVSRDEVTLSFMGKSGVDHSLVITNPTIVKTIRKCIELPGYELFQFIDEDGNRHVIDSNDVNAFLKEITSDDFSAKDFRTWGATNLSAKSFYKNGMVEDKKEMQKVIKQTVKEVSQHLNNTVKVCQSYYIHPTVINSYQEKVLVPHFQKFEGKSQHHLSWNEVALIKLLQKYT